MLSSGWRYFLAIGLSAVVALGLAAAIYRNATQTESLYEQQAKDGAQTARDSGAVHAQRACALVPLAERAECQADEYNEARDRERQEYDLQAQLVTSAWTRAMGLAALVAMVVGVIGIGLIYTTFHETRRGANYARQTLRAYIAKERALLAIGQANRASNKEAKLEGFVANLINGGLAPATIIMTQWSYMREQRWPDRFDHFDNAKRTLAPDSDGRTPLLYWGDETEGGGVLYLVGLIRYESLNERFNTPFSYCVRFCPDDGYTPDHWDAIAMYVPGMPEHT